MNIAYATSSTSTPPGVDIVTLAHLIAGLFGPGFAEWFAAFFPKFWTVYTVFAYAFSALLLFGIIYAMIRYDQISDEEQEILREEEHAYKHAHGVLEGDDKWQNILTHVGSENPNDWRLAIIEADIMLDEMLADLGYIGASIGDKLKTANPDSFQTLNDAWEAHKVRNHIAHRGSDFVLTKRIAGETINRYTRVFEEFGIV